MALLALLCATYVAWWPWAVASSYDMASSDDPYTVDAQETAWTLRKISAVVHGYDFDDVSFTLSGDDLISHRTLVSTERYDIQIRTTPYRCHRLEPTGWVSGRNTNWCGARATTVHIRQGAQAHVYTSQPYRDTDGKYRNFSLHQQLSLDLDGFDDIVAGGSIVFQFYCASYQGHYMQWLLMPDCRDPARRERDRAALKALADMRPVVEELLAAMPEELPRQ